MHVNVIKTLNSNAYKLIVRARAQYFNNYDNLSRTTHGIYESSHEYRKYRSFVTRNYFLIINFDNNTNDKLSHSIYVIDLQTSV